VARRLGQRDWELQLTLNAIDSAVNMGEWDWTLAETEEAIRTDMDPVHEAMFKAGRALIRRYRGEEWRADMDDAERLVAGDRNPQIMAGAEGSRAGLAFADGDFAAAREHWLSSVAIYSAFGSWAWLGAGQAALWEGDAEAARAILADLESSGEHNFLTGQARREIQAGLAALAGRTAESVAGYREALSRWHDAGTVFLEALCALTFVRVVGPADPDARAAAAEARVILERLRALPLLDRLDATMADHKARVAPAVLARRPIEGTGADTLA
jgi:hypothetical protein